ncbi:MAG TPA: hypothetical protein VHL52_06165 [Acidimicrobiia bacterium]|nr:hypothetical protein [Acidimicrobiia bacterium]
MKRLFAMLAVAGLAGAIVASAANLTVNGGTVQAGLDDTLTCDDSGVFVEAYGYEQAGNAVSSVRVGGIEGACVGNELHVTALDAAGNVLSESDLVVISSTTHTATFDSPVNATDLAKLQVAITS